MGVLLVFAPVLIDGKTLGTASYTLGTNGVAPFPGQDPVGRGDPYRLDVSASALAFEPWAEVNALDIWDGDIPLWNPYQAAGTPHASNMQSAVFDPLNLIVNVHPTPLTWDLTLVATFVLGAMFTYAFCRVIGMGYLAAIVGGTAFSLSGYFSLYSNNGFVRTFMYLPLLCLLVELAVRSKRFLPIPALGVAVFGSIAVGMPEIAVFVVLVGAAYALFRTFHGPRARSRARTLVILSGAFAFGVALASPLLLLFVEYESLSFNIHKGESGIGLLTDPPQRLLTWLAPFFNGDPTNATATPGTISGVRNWIGGAVFALALVGVSARTRAARLGVPFFAVVAALLLAKGYGLPVLSWIGRLPVAERVNLPGFGLPCVGFAVAIVAASGVDGIRRHEVRRSWLIGTVVLAAAGVLWLVLITRSVFDLIPTDQLFDEFGLAVVMFLGVVVLAVFVTRRVAAYAVVALVLVELVLLAPNPFAERRDPYNAPAWVDALKQELADQPTDRIFALDTLLYPNTATAYGLHDVRMLDALYVARYFDYLKLFIVPGMYDRFAGSTIGSNEGETVYRDNQMFDLLGIRYVVGTQDEPQVGFLSGLLPPDAVTDLLDVRNMSVGGEPRTAIFAHAPAEFPLVLPSPVVGRLSFSYGVDDFALTRPDADGVEFSVVAERRSGASEVIWSGLYAPTTAADPGPPGWRSAAVDIPESDDPVVSLRLRTDARTSATADWAGWTAIDMRDASGRSVRPDGALTELAEIDGVQIYENTNVLPRAFVVHDVTVVPDVDAAEAAFAAAGEPGPAGALKVTGIDVAERAVVEAEVDDIPAELTEGQPGCTSAVGDVQIVSYDSAEVRLRVDSECAGLVVLSDTYFPGWQATVNGEPATIHPTDIAFRGVVVEAGRSDVVLRYRPANYRAGLFVALAAIIAMTAAGIISNERRRRSAHVEFVR